MKQFISFIRKEFFHIFRDRRTMLILLGMPIVQIILFGFAITTEVKNVRVAVLDPSNDVVTRRIIDRMDASEYFTVIRRLHSPADMEASFGRGEIDMALVFSERFSDKLYTGEARVQLVSDATDPNMATMQAGYAANIISSAGQEMLPPGVHAAAIVPQLKLLYNPQMKSAYNFVPGVMGLILTLICGFLPALNVVGEKEAGTIEQINVTPVGKFTFIAAKLIPYWLIDFVVLTICFVLAWVLYGILPAGHFLTIYGMALFFLPVVSGFGLVISNHSTTLQQAMFVMWFFMLILILMSGLFTPIHSMPEWAQWITRINPLRYFVEVMRTIYLRGGGFAELLPQLGAVLVFALVFNLWAVKSYKKSS